MQKIIQPEADVFLAKKRRHRRWAKVVSVLGCVVVFCTTYALILPAITAEKTVCGFEEHTHTDECYAPLTEEAQTVLNCTYDTLGVHRHSEACYDADGNLICGQADYVVHTHDDNCYDAVGVLVCTLPERTAHVHTDACYTTETESHVHTDSCYELQQGELICGLEENEEHQHSAECYEQLTILTCQLEEGALVSRSVLSCGQVEAPAHQHTESCFETVEPVRELICEIPEHVHTEACYEELTPGDPTADLETAADWEASMSGVVLTGDYRADLLAIAETQLGYRESTRNFIIDEAGFVKGYTRYGEWYGIPYGDWCAMFVSFCLRYAEVPNFPYNCGCTTWINALSSEEYGLYEKAGEYEPQPGDIIFFDFDGDQASDHVGIVSELIGATETEPAKLRTIEGNAADMVCSVTYEADSAVILGFGRLPEKETGFACEKVSHLHNQYCYSFGGLLLCPFEEHSHSEECQSTEEAPEQRDLNIILPESAQIPAGYDVQYSYIDPDNQFGVMVYAPEGTLPENVVLSAELLEQGSEAYGAAEQALADTAYDGFVALDIHFTVDGEEIQPESSVYVCINVIGLLPEEVDEASLAVQHHRQSGIATLALDEEEALTGITVETVADAAQEIGQVEAVNNGTETTADIAAAFEVEHFSTFTVTWQDSYKLILHYVDAEAKSIFDGDDETALATYSELESVTLSQYANRISHSGYAYESAYVLLNDVKTTIVQVRYNKDGEKWQYAVTDGTWTDWLDGTSHTAEVYLSYTAVEGNTIVPPENNVYPVDAINVWDDNANVILISRKWIEKGNLGELFGTRQFNNYYFIRIELRSDGRYQVIQAEEAANTSSTQADDAFMLLVKKAYVEAYTMYIPHPDWPEGIGGDHTMETSGDTAQINLQCLETDVIASTGAALAYITFSPKSNDATAAARADDVAAVADSAIRFQLFNYSTKINRPNGSDEGWRPIIQYFQFRGQDDSYKSLENGDRDNHYDEDGFTVNHATVERTLTNNYPVLDPNRNALGVAKSPEVTEAVLPQSARSLAYLFSSGDGAVTAYNPSNTILQKSGTHYYYNSAYNAVDYDTNSNVFRVRSYVERNGSTATYGSAQKYYDFLPFNYTDGEVVGTYGDGARTYNLESGDVDYWFGMRMDVDFYQGKDGILNGEEMVFHFSGDDDVWVFIDDVLVLDLGGTHGTVTGYINYATGEIRQYLDWDGTVGTEDVTSFSTTLKACYEAAGKEPNGGLNGEIFADYTKHKLSFFYMERGCAVANCAIDFNLPTLPEKSLQVTKDLTAGGDADQDVVNHLQDTMTYKFRVVKAGADGKPTDNLLIKAGDTYTLSGTGISGSQTCTVGADGYFTLKSGQVAEFSNMLGRFAEDETPKQYFVQEVLPSNLTGQYGDISYTVGEGTGSCKNDTTNIGNDFTGFNSPELDPGVGNLVSYKNVVNTEQLSTLAITKVKTGSALNGEPEFYYIKVQLGPDADSLEPITVGTTYFVGDEARSVEQAGIIRLKAGETAKVKLLAGTYYKVEEVADGNGTQLTGSEGYTPTYANASGTVTELGSTVFITVTNAFPSGGLELIKIVNNTAGGSTDGEFDFALKFPVGDNWIATDYTAAYSSTNSGQTHTGDTLSFTKQDGYAVATVKLYHGEKVTITGLPSGAQVSITEVNADGYSVGWRVNSQEVYGKTANVSIQADETATVECTNTTGYELPNTGGAGTVPYTIGGLLLLTSAAFLLLYNHTKRRKEDSASS